MTTGPGLRLRNAAGEHLGEPAFGAWSYNGAELLGDAVFPPSDWGPWQLDIEHFVLRAGNYEVDLEKCLDSAQVLDWILQVGTHHPDDATLAGLVRALDDVLNPQKHLCSFGVPRRLSAAAVRKMAREASIEREQSLAVYRDDLAAIGVTLG